MEKLTKVSFIRNNKGFSLMEALVASGLFTMLAVGTYFGVEQIGKMSERASSVNTLNNRVFEIMENLRMTINQQIIYFPSDSDNETSYQNSIDALLDSNDDLPMGWSLQTEAPVAQCTGCAGRYGYVISQIPGSGNFYKVKIKFTHNDWGNLNRTYEFLVTK